MTDLIPLLREVGFTPLNIALGFGIYIVGRFAINRDREQSKTREEWHMETRKQFEETKVQVTVLRGHFEQCDRDRKSLNGRVEELSKSVESMSRCPKTDCPVRNP